MKRLYLAVLWLFAVGFTSSSYAEPAAYCYLQIMSGVLRLSETPISNAACKSLIENKIAEDMTGRATLTQSSDNEYFCPALNFEWTHFPCGARWYREYTATSYDLPGTVLYIGYWQGIPRNFSLTLDYAQGPTESPSVLTSVEPGSGEIMLKITAIDDNTGLLSGPEAVTVTTDVVANSGGHQHDNNRNTEHAGTLRSALDTTPQKTVRVQTFWGAGYFYFKPPIAAGDHVLSLACVAVAPNTCTTNTGPNKVWVGIKDLQPLWEMADYNLIGWTAIHPDNHYLTSAAVTAVHELAYYYHSVSYPLSPVLHLNDASLERGGVFDVDYNYTEKGVTHSRELEGWWTPPHVEHRRGRVIDIRANGDPTAIPRANQTEFEKMLSARKMTYIAHDLNKDNGHYHVRLLGTEQ